MFLDSGANHNFLDEDLVSRRGLGIDDLEEFDVIVVDGSPFLVLRRYDNLTSPWEDIRCKMISMMLD